MKLISNGQRLTLPGAQLLAASGLNLIEISFDGLSAIIHEDSRGEGTFARACLAIRRAQKAEIPRVGIVFTIRKENLFEVGLLPEFMEGLGIKECYVSLFKKVGRRGGEGPFQPIDTGEEQGVREYLEKWRLLYEQC